jgi:HAD superfamily hydrolase (TIGR01509 family)
VLKALLWDNDGVLVDTEPLYLRATREILATVGVHLETEQFLDYSLRQGRSLFDLVRERGSSEDEVARLQRLRNDRYSGLLRAPVPLLPGVRDCIESVRGRFRMAIVTSSRWEHFELIHEDTQVIDAFEFVLASGDYPRHKPQPDPYLLAAERLRVSPSECLVVEDSERGLRAAVAAGMRCVVVPHELTAGADLDAAWRVLSSIEELPPIVDELSGRAART